MVPSKGSVGASGDLAPLALMSGALMGLPESRVTYRGEMMPAARAFEQAGMAPTMDVQAKDATALINGATASLAYACLLYTSTRPDKIGPDKTGPDKTGQQRRPA